MSKQQHRRRGSVVVYALLAMGISFPFLALAIDLGRIAVVRAELQNAADAAALAGASVLRNGQSASQTAAETFGEYNSVNRNNAEILTSDIEIGRWNSSTRTFNTLNSSVMVNANAVRVTVQINTARNNELPLFFAPLFGRDFTELEATAVAAVDNASQMCAKIVGLNRVTMSGSSHTDSYDSSEGPYDSSSTGQNGTVCSNQNIDMSGYTEINGDAHPGPGKVVQGSGTVTGTIEPLTETLTLPGIQLRDADVNNDNYDIPLTDNGATAYYPNGLFRINDGDSITLSPGIYYFTGMQLLGTGSLEVSARTIIFVTGNVSVASTASVVNQTEIPTNLQIYCEGGYVGIGGSVDFHAAIYAPNARIVRGGSADYFGMAIGREIICSGSGGIHADDSLGVLYGLADYPTLVE